MNWWYNYQKMIIIFFRFMIRYSLQSVFQIWDMMYNLHHTPLLWSYKLSYNVVTTWKCSILNDLTMLNQQCTSYYEFALVYAWYYQLDTIKQSSSSFAKKKNSNQISCPTTKFTLPKKFLNFLKRAFNCWLFYSYCVCD